MTTGTKTSESLWDKMVRAAKFDIEFYEEVEADSTTTGQAFTVVLLVGLATGIGSGIGGLIEQSAIWFLWGLLIGIATTVIGWLIWALFAYWIGTTIFKGPDTEATYGQLLRTLGFAHSPGLLRVFSFIPYLGGLISFAASVWFLIAGIIAVRQALDFSTGRAIATCIVGWVIYTLIAFLITGFVIGAAVLF
ncbi:MAG: YIP1 family protein [Dehalococcoidia bacterium]|nr:YIP1 family protein [Dehalococcoidia bacterium]